MWDSGAFEKPSLVNCTNRKILLDAPRNALFTSRFCSPPDFFDSPTVLTLSLGNPPLCADCHGMHVENKHLPEQH